MCKDCVTKICPVTKIFADTVRSTIDVFNIWRIGDSLKMRFQIALGTITSDELCIYSESDFLSARQQMFML